MATESKLSVNQPNTLWLVARAIHLAGGNASGGSSDVDLLKFIETQDDDAGERLVANPIGFYDADAISFSDFFDIFVDKLNVMLKNYNWTNSGASSASNWKDVTTTLGMMSVDLVNEFNGKVVWKHPE